jgi:hypothetical protein
MFMQALCSASHTAMQQVGLLFTKVANASFLTSSIRGLHALSTLDRLANVRIR